MKHKFVDFIPNEIEEGVLYISIEYDVAKHKCACGCGTVIVTTLSPTRWKLTYDGETVSLSPSIGNWAHPCQSHYFIENDAIIWARSFSKKRIQDVIEADQKAHKEHYKKASKITRLVRKIFK